MKFIVIWILKWISLTFSSSFSNYSHFTRSEKIKTQRQRVKSKTKYAFKCEKFKYQKDEIHDNPRRREVNTWNSQHCNEWKMKWKSQSHGIPSKTGRKSFYILFFYFSTFCQQLYNICNEKIRDEKRIMCKIHT